MQTAENNVFSLLGAYCRYRPGSIVSVSSRTSGLWASGLVAWHLGTCQLLVGPAIAEIQNTDEFVIVLDIVDTRDPRPLLHCCFG